MIGGNIPQQTRVVSTQIYGHVESLAYTQAHWLSGGMLVFSFLVLLGLSLFTRRTARVMP
jgi:molybdate transport system permease protein